jgi:3',5'-cyclic AMP phosphodiesterase CpdA
VKLWAISDLHIGYEINRRAVEAIETAPEDWLIIGGDTGDSPAHLDFVLRTLEPRFAQIIWVPGNHDLWTPPSLPAESRGDAHYRRLVKLCRSYGVLTPEDPYAVWPGVGPRTVIVPAFVLYDYSFRPASVSRDAAVAWAAETGVRCADEDLLAPDPYPSRDAWCHARVDETEMRLGAIPADLRIVLVNHFPLRYEHGVPPRIPRFSIWCGTTQTEDWHRQFPIDVVIHGHLHLPSSQVVDGVRFEEVSLGYPREWSQRRGVMSYLRRIK